MDWLRGTPIWPDQSVWRNSVVFLETSEDAPSAWAVVRMLRALAATGALQRAASSLGGPTATQQDLRNTMGRSYR